MNIKLSALVSVLALTTSLFAVEPVASTPASNENAPAETPANVATNAQSSASAPEAVAAPSSETLSVNLAETSAQPAAEEPVIPAAEPVNDVVAEDPSAPVAVRGGTVPEAAPAATAAPASTQQPQTTTVTKVIYQPVYSPEPTAVRSDYVPVKTVYVAQQTTGADTVSFDELRGLIPMKTTLGLQGFIGSYGMSGDHGYYDDFESYTGMTWRIGAFGIIPVSEYSVGVKVGAMYEQSEGSESARKIKAKIKQSKIDIPVTFVFKAPRSRLMFEVGAEASIAIRDELKVTSNGSSSKLDMLDKDFRKPVDWNMVCGFSVGANQYISLDFRFDIGFASMYDSDNSENMKILNVDELTPVAFMLGMSFNIL